MLIATFLLVITRDLTEGILAGLRLSALLFLHRMAGSIEVDSVEPDDLDPATASDRDVVVCRISSAVVFGAAAAVGTVLDRLTERPRAYVLDLTAVAVLDSTAAAMLHGFVRQARRRGAAVFIAGARPGHAGAASAWDLRAGTRVQLDGSARRGGRAGADVRADQPCCASIGPAKAVTRCTDAGIRTPASVT